MPSKSFLRIHYMLVTALILFCFIVIPWAKSRAFHMLAKCSPTEPQFQSYRHCFGTGQDNSLALLSIVHCFYFNDFFYPIVIMPS